MAVHTIRPGQSFVDALAAGLLAEADGPLALADMLVLLPTRRACRALREAFLRGSGGEPLLLPQVQPIGDVLEDDLLTAGAVEIDLPPVLPALRRRFLLARLVAAARAMPLAHAVRLAGELESFLDEVQTHRIDLARLDALVPHDYAAHWQETLRFLDILRKAWPAVLAEEGTVDPAARRDRLLGALAESWRRNPPERRIVAAGSTGSIPATRELLTVIARLPRGEVVLPGLDRAMDEASWQALEAGHPQHGLKVLIEALAVDRADVADWPETAGTPPARARFLSEVMRPAATTAAWQGLARPPAEALRGLAVAESPDAASEAQLLAMKLREALEVPGRTAALVTPDRQLARRVAVELERWDVEVDDSAGTPLDQTPPGSFLLLTAHVLAEGAAPVPLLSALEHPLARGEDEQGDFRRMVRLLEIEALRGPRVAGGLPGLYEVLREAGRRDPAAKPLIPWLDRIRRAGEPFAALGDSAPLGLLLRAHVAFAEWLAGGADGSRLWAREAGEAAAMLVAELHEAARDLPPLDVLAYPALLAQLMAERPVRPRDPRHARIQILGQLEARLQHRDLMLLAGLNEGTWPRDVDPGPWLGRTMRRDLGLPPLEQQVGLAAHDLVQLASAREVLLSRAGKDTDGKPTVTSRFLVRLDAVLSATGAGELRLDPAWQAWCRALDLPDGPPRPIEPPAPRPPVSVRPRELPVTDIELWMRDPYALYAKRILGLEALDDLDADPGFAERGQIVHRVLEQFVRQHPETLPNNAEHVLLTLGGEVFKELAHRPQVHALWWPRFIAVARWFLEVERERRGRIARVLGERRGRTEIGRGRGTFRVTARADRLELWRDGGIGLIDYKTGRVPSIDEVDAFVAVQLPLEGLMARDGGFEATEAGPLADLSFWRLTGGDPPGERVPAFRGRHRAPDPDPNERMDEVRERLVALVERFDKPATPYHSRPRPRYAPAYSDYDHLARVAEWAGPEDT
jgi:ATP-dependent helicase/nuclease subunit B